MVLLSHVFSKNAILHKGCTKNAQNAKPLKIKHLNNFFVQRFKLLKIKHLHDISKVLKIKHLRGFLCILCKPKKAPFKPATPPHPLGTIFAGKMSVFSIQISIYTKCTKKTSKPLKIKGLGLCARFCASFVHPLCKIDRLPKTCYNKAPPKPRPLLSTTQDLTPST